MSNIVIIMTIHYLMFVAVVFYNFCLKAELKAYRKNEQAKKEIAGDSTLEGRLLKSGGAVHKY